jgi:hypothetical protein
LQAASKKAGYEKRFLQSPEFPSIEEQEDFDWKITEPLQFRPFKPKYHLTMGECLSFPISSAPFSFFCLCLPGQNEKERLTKVTF